MTPPPNISNISLNEKNYWKTIILFFYYSIQLSFFNNFIVISIYNFKYSLIRIFSYFQDSSHQNHRENNYGQESCFQISSKILCGSSYNEGSRRTSKIPCESKERKHGRSTSRTGFCCNAEASGPHDAYRQAAESAAEKRQSRWRRPGSDKITYDT